MIRSLLLAGAALLAIAPPAGANDLTDAQRAALQPLTIFDGTWRGPAQLLRREGWTTITQTERVGPMPPMRIFEMHLRRLGSTSWPQDDVRYIVFHAFSDPAVVSGLLRVTVRPWLVGMQQ